MPHSQTNQRMYDGRKLKKTTRSNLQSRLTAEKAGKTKRSETKKSQLRKNVIGNENKEKTIKVTFKQLETELLSTGTGQVNLESCNSLDSTPPRRTMVNAKKTAMDLQNGDVNWVAIVGHNEREADAEEKLYAKLEKNSQIAFRSDLEHEIAAKEQRRKDEHLNLLQERQALAKEYQRVENEEVKKLAILHAKTEELKKIRDDQISDVHKRRVREERKVHRFELRSVQRLQEELRAEKDKNEAKKLQEKSKLEEMLVDNERQKQIKAAAKRMESEEAIHLQKEYAAMLEKQERAREDRLNATYAKQQHTIQALVAATADIHAQARTDAIKAEKELKVRQLREDDKARLKDQALKKLQNECQVELAAQIIAKKERMKREIEEDRAYGRQLQRQSEEFLQKQREEESIKQKKLTEQARFLEEQIKLVQKRKEEEKTEMNETEKQLNSHLLKTVKEGKMQVKEQPHNPQRPYEWRYNYRKAPF
jgi:hypothetical protein